ncbi:MAG TPA: ATP-binding protein [Caulobacteraceae bacterium]|jgi:signal transduction histidine kinase
MSIDRTVSRDEKLSRGDARPHAEGFEFTLDRRWRITSITPSAAAWAGSSVENLIGRDGRDLNPLATEILADRVEAALATGAVSTSEQPSSHVPGRWVRIEIGPLGEGVRIQFEDITSEVAARRLAESSEDSAPVALGVGPAEIVLLDEQGVIVATNAAWRAGIAALGLNQADVGVGACYAKVAKAVVPKTDEATFAGRLAQLFSGRVPTFEATFSQATREGSTRRQVRIAPMHVGRQTYYIAMHEDLTERARVLAALHETSDQLLHAQEKERQRIAVELHDSMSQHLAALGLGVGSLRRRVNDPAAQALIDDMDKLVQEAGHEMRVLAYLLNASGRESEGLEASARRFVEGFGRRTGLKATCETKGPVDEVCGATHHAVFRVIQEALTNVHRHARATRVDVALANVSGQLTLRVEDDGQGIAPLISQPAEIPLGVGIPGMRARIEQLGGRLEIENGAPGTIVSATLPLKYATSTALNGSGYETL